MKNNAFIKSLLTSFFFVHFIVGFSQTQQLQFLWSENKITTSTEFLYANVFDDNVIIKDYYDLKEDDILLGFGSSSLAVLDLKNTKHMETYLLPPPPCIAPSITQPTPFCITDTAINLSVDSIGGTWSGTGITNISLGTFDPTTAGIGTHQIIYAITGAPCSGADTINVTVNTCTVNFNYDKACITYGTNELDFATSLLQLDDGGFILGGIIYTLNSVYNINEHFIRIDLNGNIMWELNVGTALSNDVLFDMALLPDGNLIATGYTESSGAGLRDIVVNKINTTTGLNIWSKTYGGTLMDEAVGITISADSNIIVVGRTQSFGAGNFDSYLIKINHSTGNIIWDKTLGGFNFDALLDVTTASNGDIIVAGYAHNFAAGNQDVYVARLNATTGAIIWDYTYGGTSLDRGTAITESSSGNIYVGGLTRSYTIGSGDYSLQVLKLSATGDFIAGRSFQTFNTNVGIPTGNMSILELTPNEIVVSGVYGAAFGLVPIKNYIIKLDSTLNFVSSVVTDRNTLAASNIAPPIVKTNSSNIAFLGFTKQVPALKEDYILVKLDSSFSSCCTSPLTPINTSFTTIKSSITITEGTGVATVGIGFFSYLPTPTVTKNFVCPTPPSSNLCDTAANLIIYSNYNGGFLNINVDQNIPNLKIGVVSYEAVEITLSGPYVGNVTDIYWAGTNATNITCGFAGPSSTTAGVLPPTNVTFHNLATVTLSDPSGNNNIVGNYVCANSSAPTGGTNTGAQIEHFFATLYPAAALRFHDAQYGCWSQKNISDGGSCCELTAIISSSIDTICQGNSITFTDSSNGFPTSWDWTFNNGSTTTSTTQGPHIIPFNAVGTYTISLTVNDGVNSETTSKIIVVTNCSPINSICTTTGTPLRVEQGKSIINTSDGGFITLANSQGTLGNDFYVVKYNSMMAIQWEKLYTANSGDAYNIIETLNGDYVLCGNTNFYGGGANDAYFMKINNVGTVLWSKTIGNNTNEYAFRVIENNTGGYTAVGGRFIYNFDVNGTILWIKSVGGSGATITLKSIIQTADNGFACTGEFDAPTGTKKVLIAKVDSAGNFIFSKLIGLNGIDQNAESIIEDPNGNLVFSGRQDPDQMYLGSINNIGTVLNWTKTIGGSGTERAWEVINTSDGGFATIGQTNSIGAGGNDFYLVKMDSIGNMQWDASYGGNNNDEAFSLTQASDDGFVISGKSTSYGPYLLYVIKTDNQGLSCCKTGYGNIQGTGGVLTNTSLIMQASMLPSGNGSATLPQVSAYSTPCPPLKASFTLSSDTICFGDSITFTDNSIGAITAWTWTFNGGNSLAANTQGFHTIAFNTAGTYNINLLVDDGSTTDDTTITIHVGQPTFGTDIQTACGSLTWIDGNTYISNNTTAIDTLFGGNSTGCDSIVTLNLTIIQDTTGIDTVIACGFHNWIDGVTYTSNNTTAIDTLFGGAANGCDSIVTLNLTIIPFGLRTDTHTVCNTFTWFNGTTYTSSTNTATDTIFDGAANGCDSIVTLNLTVINTVRVDTITECNSYTWVNGTTYTSSNNTAVYTIPGIATMGCDSIMLLNLTINSNVTSIDGQYACNTFTWIDGNTYTTSNSTATFTIVGGAFTDCDSIVTLNLTIDSCLAKFTVSDSSICETDCINFIDQSSQTLAWNWIFPSGNPSSSIIQNPTVCFDTNGVYLVSLITTIPTGFDTATQNIIVTTLPTLSVSPDITINLSESTDLTGFGSNTGTYTWSPNSWLSCDACQTTITTPEETITYTITLQDSGCTIFDTVMVTVDFINSVFVPNIFSPNEDGRNDILYVQGKTISKIHFIIYNRWGEKVFETSNINKGWDGNFRGNPLNKSVFVYYLKATFKDGSSSTKKGDITLVR